MHHVPSKRHPPRSISGDAPELTHLGLATQILSIDRNDRVIPDHPWFMGVQYHPEFKSQPTKPHPLFAGFVAAAVERNRARSEQGTGVRSGVS